MESILEHYNAPSHSHAVYLSLLFSARTALQTGRTDSYPERVPRPHVCRAYKVKLLADCRERQRGRKNET